MESIKELRKICQPKEPEHPVYRFWRFFNIYPTKLFLIMGLKPNTITLFGFLLGIVGGYFYLKSQFLVGSFFFLGFLVLDDVDGNIARYRKLSSEFGRWLDITVGHLLYPYFFLTLGLGVFFQTGIFLYFFLGALAAVSKLIERSVPRSTMVPIEKKKEAKIWRLKEHSSFIGKFSILFPAMILFSLAGWEKGFLWFFATYLMLFASGKLILTGWRIYKYNP